MFIIGLSGLLNTFQGQEAVSSQLLNIIQQTIKMLNALRESEVKALKKAGKKEIKNEEDSDEDEDDEDEDDEDEEDEDD